MEKTKIPILSLWSFKLEVLEKLCVKYMEYILEKGEIPKDIEHAIFKSAMEYCFGKDDEDIVEDSSFWKWIDKNLKK